MAVHLATSSDYLRRTTALLPASGDSTVCYWERSNAISTAPAYQTSYIILDDPAVYTNYTGLFNNSTANTLDAAGQIVHASVASVSVWYHRAWVQSGTTQRLYINGTLIGSVTKNRAAWTNGFELLGNDTFSDGDLSIAYCREWTAALTTAQILVEMQATAAVHTANLYMDCPFTSTILDVSGNGHNWTQQGSATFVAGPSLPSNSSAATATAFGTLPQDITQDFGDGRYAWFSYTGHADEVVAGFWAHADIPTDTVRTSVYQSDGTTLLLSGDANNVPMQVPQSSGDTIYFYVHSDVPLSTDLTFSAVAGPTSTVPVGAIFTNDDVVGLGTAVVSPDDGANYQVLQFFDLPATASENGGDVLENGRFLLASDDDSTFKLYDGQLQLLTQVATLTSTTSSCVRTCITPQVFYVGRTPTTTGIARIDGTGIVTDTWTLPSTGVSAVAASNDELVIYVVQSASVTNTPIKQLDPATSLYGADLAAGIASYLTRDMLVMGDDSVVVIYSRLGHATQILRYDAAGATLNTYTLGTPVGSSASSDVSLFHAIDDPNSFWTRVHNTPTAATCAFYNIKASDGSILSTVTQASYEEGVYDGTATLTPPARFGLSECCPSFILREAIGPPTPVGEPVEYLIRRERWWPHISSEQFRQFFSMLQVDLFAGNGITAGPAGSPVQGEDPLLEVDWSDDGGHTWSSIHFVHTGKIGAYRQRAILRRMGYSRDRVYRIACTDPVAWVVVNGYLDAVLGTS